MRAARFTRYQDISESEQKIQARFSTVGKIERCWEKTALAAAKNSIYRLSETIS
jgi:hypothetical protein